MPQPEALSTADDVIEALGGLTAVSRLIGTTPQAVYGAKLRGNFPADTFLVLNGALEAKNKVAPHSLWRMKEALPQVASAHP